MARAAHQTALGRYYIGDCTKLLQGELGRRLRGRVQLILTSPPYPLNRQKSYGNLTGDSYRSWFVALAPLFADLLRPDGSLVIELGNAWMPGRPVQSLLHLESLMGFVQHPKADLRLCQQFVCYNPSKLPTPAAWVTVRKDRLTDSFTHLWWIAKTDFPKADNRRVLRPYGADMQALLRRGTYNQGARPSQHHVRGGFLNDRGGSLAHNVIELEPMDAQRPVRVPNAISLANTVSNDYFARRCRALHVRPHPARMPLGLATFFVEFLTEPGDLVLDPFAGSNTTGFAAEFLDRRWISLERDRKYLRQTKIRLHDPVLNQHVPQQRGAKR